MRIVRQAILRPGYLIYLTFGPDTTRMLSTEVFGVGSDSQLVRSRTGSLILTRVFTLNFINRHPALCVVEGSTAA